MTWVRKYFKGRQKVWVEIDDEGALVLDARGLVAMRYKNEEGAKTYNAHPRNLGGDAGGGGSKGGGGGSSSNKKGASPYDSARIERAAGDPSTSEDVPHELLDEPAPPAGVVEVYTDGACQGNPGPCSYGVVIRSGDSYQEISQYLGEGTNNIGELMAIRVALDAIEDTSAPVRIHTDSSYSIGVLTKGWKARANTGLIRRIKRRLAEFDDVELIKVKGHAGIPLNERADTLAVGAIELWQLTNGG